MDAETLADLESCNRRGYWSETWESNRLHPTKMLYMAIEEAMTQTERDDRGEVAGETVVTLCADRGIDTNQPDKYHVGNHHAVLADIVTSYLTSLPNAPWRRLEPAEGPGVIWQPTAFLDASGRLVRPILVDGWDDERQQAELHSWHTLGNMAFYELPMTLEVIILGVSRNGRRHSAWSKGLCHPRNKKLRFQKQSATKDTTFAESWRKVWREDYASITRQQWLEAMAEDRQFEELTRHLGVSLPGADRTAELRDIIRLKAQLRDHGSGGSGLGIPLPSYSACDWPRPCPFRRCCLGSQEILPSENEGFFRKGQASSGR